MTTADPTDTAAALTAAWYALAFVLALGEHLVSRDEDMAVLHGSAGHPWTRLIAALDAAPPLPVGVHGLGLNTEPGVNADTMAVAYRAIPEILLALNALFPGSGTTPADRQPRSGARC